MKDDVNSMFELFKDQALKLNPAMSDREQLRDNSDKRIKPSSSLLSVAKEFLVEANLANTSALAGTESISTLNTVTKNACGAPLATMLDKMHFPKYSSSRASAAEAAALYLANNTRNHGAAQITSHFANPDKFVMSTSYAPTLTNMVTPQNFSISNESFGTDVNRVISDVAKGLAINVAQSDTAILNKLMHRKMTAVPTVTFDVVSAELYDFLKSNDKSSDVRNGRQTLKPFIELYMNPREVSNELQPLIPLKANAKADEVYKDGFINNGKSANLFDLSLDANKPGFTHVNYTDLVSTNVKLSKVIVRLKTNGSVTWAANKTEEFVIDVSHARAAQLTSVFNVTDSAKRSTVCSVAELLSKDTKKVDGGASEILSKCTATDKVKLVLNTAATVNLSNAITDVFGNGKLYGYTSSDGELIADLKTTLLPNVTIEVVAISLQAYASEENMRKSNLAIQTKTANFHFEIASPRNIMVDYSLQTPDQEDAALSFANEAAALGVDHRGIYVTTETLKYCYNQNRQLKADGHFGDVRETINHMYVAGMQVNPTALLGSIDCNQLNTLRSSDLTGDIRGMMETRLISTFAQFYQDSLFRQRLNEKPRFRVLTSPLMLSTLLQMPHIHDHLQALSGEQLDSNGVDYLRVLPDGTILEVITSNYEYLRTKMIMIPMTSDADNILNFGANYDCGTFVASYVPSDNNAAWNRIFTNSRSQVIPTNPSGIYYTIENLDKIVQLDETVGFDSDDLPSAKEQLAAHMEAQG